MDQPFRILQQIRSNPLRPNPKISEDRTRNRRPEQSHDAESLEIHPHDPGRNGNQMPDPGQQAREENAAGFIAGKPMLGFLQFLRRK